MHSPCTQTAAHSWVPPPASLFLHAVDERLIIALWYLCKRIGLQVALHGMSGHEQQALMECSVQSWTGLAAAAASQVKCPSPGAW